MFHPKDNSSQMAIAWRNEKKMKVHGAAVIIIDVLDPIFSLMAGSMSLNRIYMTAASIMA